MKLARFSHQGSTTWGFVEAASVLPVPADAPDLVGALTDGLLAELRARTGSPLSLSAVHLLAPIARPGQVICVGLNYFAHARESGLQVPAEPLLFMKSPGSITGPHEAIVLPAASTQVDWEAELAVVIGTATGPVDEAAALQHVGGYLVANDVSARDLQSADGQWVRAKSYRTFCPLGPWLTTADEIGDGSGRRITLAVNGVRKQDSNTSDLVADVARIVSYVSRVTDLEPGDVLLTGTPSGTGIGQQPPEFLADGDRVEVEIEGLGRLSNPVVNAEKGSSS
jgi:2-keto-4-pentenoate hydratase/2-oxohepta-3-ene-1,7-dioic acid hydratase in catechol pathway